MKPGLCISFAWCRPRSLPWWAGTPSAKPGLCVSFAWRRPRSPPWWAGTPSAKPGLCVSFAWRRPCSLPWWAGTPSAKPGLCVSFAWRRPRSLPWWAGSPSVAESASPQVRWCGCQSCCCSSRTWRWGCCAIFLWCQRSAATSRSGGCRPLCACLGKTCQCIARRRKKDYSTMASLSVTLCHVIWIDKHYACSLQTLSCVRSFDFPVLCMGTTPDQNSNRYYMMYVPEKQHYKTKQKQKTTTKNNNKIRQNKMLVACACVCVCVCVC